MVLLKTLNLPALTPEILQFFAEQEVVTVEDFVCKDLHSLSGEAERSLVAAAFNQAVREVLVYLDQFQEDWTVGTELVEDCGQFLPISCASVDSLLNGGLQEGTITELVGASSTGKSQMCMQAAASVAYWLQSTVIYVDTCRTFSGKRVAKILESFLGRHETEMKDREDMGPVMKCIQRIGIFDIFSMLSFLRSLHASLQSKRKIGGDFSHLRLLIIDSASSVVSPVLGATNARGHSLMISLARSLNKLAINNRIAVLVCSTGHLMAPFSHEIHRDFSVESMVLFNLQITNHTVIGDEGQLKAALGESWMSVPHVRLWLARDSNSDVCEAILSKHTSLACNKQAAFYMDTSGLQSIDDSGISTPSPPSQ